MSLLDKILKKYSLSDTKKNIVKNLYWAILGKVITLVGALLVGILVARYLGPEDYGLMNYIISYIAIFQVVANFGLDNIEIREESKADFPIETVIGTAFILKLGLAALTIFAIIITTVLFEASVYTRWMVCLYSLSIILNTSSVIRNYFTSIVWNEYIVKTEISRTLIGAAVKIVLLLLKANLTLFILATLFDVALLASGYFLSYSRKIGNIRKWSFNKKAAKYLLKQSLPLLLSGTAIIIYQRIDQVMIGNMIDKASVAFFSVAGKFVEILVFIPTIMAQTVTPILVRQRKESEILYEARSQLFMNVTVWGCLIMAIFVSAISFPLIRYTFGVKYLAAVPVLQIMSYKVVGMALSNTAGQKIIIEGKQKYAFIRNLLGCLLCIGLNFILIPHVGIIGSAIVTVITTLFSGFIANIFIPPYWKYMKQQGLALLTGWRDLVNIKKLFN